MNCYLNCTKYMPISIIEGYHADTAIVNLINVKIGKKFMRLTFFHFGATTAYAGLFISYPASGLNLAASALGVIFLLATFIN